VTPCLLVKPLAVIAAHSAAGDAILRHLPFWRSSGLETCIYFSDEIPAHVAAEVPTARILGPSGHTGEASIQRIKELLRRAVSNAVHHQTNHVLIGEYDVVAFRPPPVDAPPPMVVMAPLHPNGDDRFSAPFYPHVFWRMSRETCRHLCGVAFEMPDTAEHSMGDRWFAALCAKAGVNLVNDAGMFSRNSLDRPEYIAGAQRCLAEGGWAVHGVKTKEMLVSLCYYAPPPETP